MNVNDPAHLTEEPHERADATRRGLTAALGGRWSRAVRAQEDAAAAGEAARIAISLILRDEKGNFVFWRSEYVRKPAKGESRAFSIQIYGLPKYASYEAYAYAS